MVFLVVQKLSEVAKKYMPIAEGIQFQVCMMLQKIKPMSL